MGKGWKNPHYRGRPSEDILALSKPGKLAHSARRRKQAMRRKKQRER